MNRRRALPMLAGPLLVLVLSGCGPAPLPDCDAPEIVETVDRLVKESIRRDGANIPAFVQQLEENVDMQVVEPRTQSRAASGEEVRCSAQVLMRLRTTQPNPRWRGPPPEQRLPVAYRLSYNDRGEVWVEVQP